MHSLIRFSTKSVLTRLRGRDQLAEFGSAAQLDQEGIQLQCSHRAIPLLNSALHQPHAHIFLATECQKGSEEILIFTIGVNAEGSFHFLCELIPIRVRRMIDTCGYYLRVSRTLGLRSPAVRSIECFFRLTRTKEEKRNISVSPVRASVQSQKLESPVSLTQLFEDQGTRPQLIISAVQ